MKTLLIKASGITVPSWRGYNSGVGRSTYLLLDALSKIDDIPFDMEVYVDGLSSIGFDFYNWNFRHHIFPLPEKYGCKKTKLEPWYRTHFMKNDLLHIPHNIDAVLPNEKYVVTFHDVIAYDNAIKTGNIIEQIKWIDMAKNAVGIITCSNFSKGEIVNKLNVPEEKVSVVYWGTAIDKFYSDIEETKTRLKALGIDYPYFVSISCAHPRKNIRVLLEAYKKFLQTNPEHRLVLVWSNPPADLLQKYAKEIENKKIIFLNYVTDADLRALYEGATCTMFPTRSEGFGFPILESFACGTPIMTCRNTCLEEVGQDAAIYVGEDAIDEMVDVMKMFEGANYDLNAFDFKSKRVINSFSWENTARNYISFYQKYL